MFTYFARVPEADAHVEPDGHHYALTTHYLDPVTLRLLTDRGRPRLLRVHHMADGDAFVCIGRAGDAIAPRGPLPDGVEAVHS
jgi:hypothetical protein